MLKTLVITSSVMLPVKSGELHNYFIDSTAKSAAGFNSVSSWAASNR